MMGAIVKKVSVMGKGSDDRAYKNHFQFLWYNLVDI